MTKFTMRKKIVLAFLISYNHRNFCFSEARTFGHHFLKRISFAIIPAAFVIGVITTLLAALTVVSIKGLGVGVRI